MEPKLGPQLEQKLVVAQRATERKMLNISLRDRQKSTDTRQNTKVTDIIVKIKEMK